jgi:hypothetical protein
MSNPITTTELVAPHPHKSKSIRDKASALFVYFQASDCSLDPPLVLYRCDHAAGFGVTKSGKRQPSDLIRAKLIEKIGFDPWQYAEWLKPTEISQETIQLAEPFIQNAKA